MMAVVSPLLGSALSTDATMRHHFALKRSRDFEAEQLDTNAGQVIAAGTHEVEDEARKYEVLQSQALAVAGHSGGGTMDNNVVNIIAGIAEEGERTSQRIMFSARDKARVMKTQAGAKRFEGDQIAKAGKRKGINTLLSGAGMAAINYFGAGKTTRGTRLVGFA